MKTDRAVSEEEFLSFVGRNVVAWSENERETIETAIKKLQPLLRALPLSLPDTIEFVRTTGAEEGKAAYTRTNAIVLPPAELAESERDLQRLICHELFHILSRRNPPLREEMYAAIGFVKCEEIEFPAVLRARKITNPDAPRNDHFIRLENAGATFLAVPILFATTETYDVQRGGEFFDYLSFDFLVVSHAADSHRVSLGRENSAPKLLSPQAVTGFYEQIGRNTQYIIHREEILADNFALLILGEENVPSPEVLQKMRAILAQSTK